MPHLTSPQLIANLNQQPAWSWNTAPWVPVGLENNLWALAATLMLPTLLAVALFPHTGKWRQTYQRWHVVGALLLLQLYLLMVATSVLTTWPSSPRLAVVVFTLACTVGWWHGLRKARSHTIVGIGVGLTVLAMAYLTEALIGGLAHYAVGNLFLVVTTLLCGYLTYLAGIAMLHGLRAGRMIVALVLLALISVVVALRLAYDNDTNASIAAGVLALTCLLCAAMWARGHSRATLGIVTGAFLASSITLTASGQAIAAFVSGACALATALSVLALRRRTAGSAAVASLMWSLGLMVLSVHYLLINNSLLVVPLACSAAVTGVGGLALLVYGGDALRQSSLNEVINQALDWLGHSQQNPSHTEQKETGPLLGVRPKENIWAEEKSWPPNTVVDLTGNALTNSVVPIGNPSASNNTEQQSTKFEPQECEREKLEGHEPSLRERRVTSPSG